MSDVIDRLVENNGSAPAPGPLPAPPQLRVAVVACMDARIDVHRALGLEPGEAHVIRNAGGVVTDDVIRSLAISQRRLGTTAVMLIHHTGCGMAGLDESSLRQELTDAAGGQAPPFGLGGFADVEADVRESLRRVQDSPYLAHRDIVRGFVLDVESGRLSEVRPAAG
jgi:carbonic anhydrase